MRKTAILAVASVIFSIAFSHANAQVELNRNQNESQVTKQTTHETPRQANADTPKTPETAKVASIPESTPNIAPAVVQTPELSCGSQDPAKIYAILAEIGVPRSSAIQLIGSWKTESHLDPCQKIGDNGVAWGLNSWHPGRRQDMPETLREQVIWAVTVEMKRDCASCYQTIMSGGDKWTIRSAIKQTTRWGTEGARWTYADQFENIL
jgi:hypothetical protein